MPGPPDGTWRTAVAAGLSRQLSTHDLRACTECTEFAARHVPGERCHAAVGGGIELVGIDEAQRLAQRLGHFLRCLDRAACHVDGTDHHLLAADEFDQIDRHVRVVAFQRNDVERGCLQLGKRLFVLAPLRAQRLLPVSIGLDAVAIADVDGGLALQPFHRAFQGGNTPVVDLVEEDIEGRLVELDDVHAGGFQFPGLLIEDLGKLPCQFFAAFVVRIEEGVDHRHRARQRPLDRLAGLLTQEFGIVHEHRRWAADRADHGRHAGVVAVANPHRLALFEIDTAEMFDKGGDEMLTGLFAVADDIDAGMLLFLQRQPQCILLAFDQFGVLQFPGRPQGLGLGKPGRLGQATGG
ncbi:hypothetical protein XAP6164_2380026 [Xanthomonas phaseoli pv. phaseoli]|nr:hypothetical protein XAP6164_2380026 [Xanthomonas phaseoli pv. phaseoli]